MNGRYTNDIIETSSGQINSYEDHTMGAYQIKNEIYKALEEEISMTNRQLLKSLQGKEKILNTVEFIKISFSENLLEDIEFLNSLSGNPIFKIRHADMILRDILEQVIEFIFLMKHPDTISDYLGLNIDDNSEKSSDPIKEIHKIGCKRFKDGRKSVSAMAKDIGEKESSSNRITLYDIYQLLSEACHNSYFFAGLDDAETAETGKEFVALSEEQVQQLIIIIGYFMETYSK